MPKFVSIDEEGALELVAAALQRGEAVVLPTDTVYGLATLPTKRDLLYVLKGRPESVPIAVLVDSVEQARGLVDVSGAALRLARAFWPGPLTIVLPQRNGGGTLGVRCPDHVFIHVLTRRVGPLAVTSANRHGEPTPETAADAAAALTGDVAVVVDGGPCQGTASTVVDATQIDLPVLRAGPITEGQIRAAALR